MTTNHPLYNTWYSIMERCTRPEHKMYSEYGGRGINLHSDWLEWKNFKKYILENLGLKPAEDSLRCSLVRIDKSKGYEPGNVAWGKRKYGPRKLASNAKKVPYRGVTVDATSPRKPYKAQIILVKGKSVHLGYFESPEDAARAFDERAAYENKENGREFKLNFPAM